MTAKPYHNKNQPITQTRLAYLRSPDPEIAPWADSQQRWRDFSPHHYLVQIEKQLPRLSATKKQHPQRLQGKNIGPFRLRQRRDSPENSIPIKLMSVDLDDRTRIAYKNTIVRQGQLGACKQQPMHVRITKKIKDKQRIKRYEEQAVECEFRSFSVIEAQPKAMTYYPSLPQPKIRCRQSRRPVKSQLPDLICIPKLTLDLEEPSQDHISVKPCLMAVQKEQPKLRLVGRRGMRPRVPRMKPQWQGWSLLMEEFPAESM